MRANAHPADRAGTELYRGSELVPQARARGTWEGVVRLGSLPPLPFEATEIGKDAIPAIRQAMSRPAGIPE